MPDFGRRPQRPTAPPQTATGGPNHDTGPDNSLVAAHLQAAHLQAPQAEGGGLLGMLMEQGGALLQQGWSAATDTTPLRLGDSGIRVLNVQNKLKSLGWDLGCDGTFGPDTKRVVQAFQMENGLEPDGVVGAKTIGDLMDARTFAQQQDHDNEEARQAKIAAQPKIDDPETGGETKVPLRDVIYEQLAHRAAYQQFPATFQQNGPEDFTAFDKARKDANGDLIPKWIQSDNVRTLIQGLGYTPQVVHEDRLTGFQAVLFEPTLEGVAIADHPEVDRLFPAMKGGGPGLRPVVAFRGSQDQKSWADDYNKEGVGAYQFRMNEADIVELLERGRSEAGPPDVVGHSLGGALAQLAAAHHASQVNEVVTFQAAAIPMEDAVRAGQAGVESTHYRVKGDLVPLSGEAFTPGIEETFSASGSSKYTYGEAHITYPLERAHAGETSFSRVPIPVPYVPLVAWPSRDITYDAEQVGPHLPALDTFHDKENQGDSPGGLQRIKPRAEATPGSGQQGGQEFGRKHHIGDFHTQPIDHMNAPITRLLDELRAELDKQDEGQAFDPEPFIRHVTATVQGSEGRMRDETVQSYADGYFKMYKDDKRRSAILAFDAGWAERRDRIIEQISRLARRRAGAGS
jgi:peptidoglycan hydrolase-like protein with peptidoglycan-binding domain/pimeloyl-ACP methyl ester carboxylesterase